MFSLDDAKSKGFVFPGAVDWMDTSSPAKMEQLAKDAALVTTPNALVPAEFTAYIDPVVVEILTAVRNARKLFGEVKKGDWTAPYAKFRVEEITGVTTPYTDYADGAVAGVNPTWPSREQYIFQTTIKYGDLESDIAAVAKMNLAASKQKAAARVIDIDANKFYLYGVSGKAIYGLLNDPNLNSAVTPITVGGQTVWSAKGANDIYNDILKLWADIKTKSGGNVDEDTDIVLAVCPESSSEMGKINTLGISVFQMLANLFKDRLTIVELPELYDANSGSTVFMGAKKVLENPVAQLAFGEKYRAHPIVRKTSSFEQKISASTYGCVLYYPFAVGTMTGV